MKAIRNAWPILLLWAILVSAYFSNVFKNEALYGVLHADAQGYYGYLVATLVEGSFDWEQVISSYADQYFAGTAADFTVETEQGRVNKYYAGTALLMLPFFLIAMMYAWIMGFPLDGYAPPFMDMAVIAAVTYASIGAWLLSKFLVRRGITLENAMIASVSCVLATGVFHYSVSEPAMSHAYSFFLICAFLFLVQRLFAVPTVGRVLLAAFVFGLIVLVRPSNGMVIASVPFIAGGFGAIKNLFKSQEIYKWLGTGLLVVLATLSLQAIVYQLQVGRPLIWAYKGEGFDFTDPEMLKVLFSYRKGFFVYTPWAFLGAVGLLWFLMKKRAEGLWLLGFLLLTVYVVSCWWNWHYGSSYGMRALIEYTPFFAVGLAYLLQSIGSVLRYGTLLLLGFFVYLNAVQSYQYSKFILHWDQMNKERYWQIFMKTARKYDGIFYRKERVLNLPKEADILDKFTYYTDLEEDSAKVNWPSAPLTECYSGNVCDLIGKGDNFGWAVERPFNEMGVEGKKRLHYSMMVWSEQALPDLSLAFSYRKEEMMDYGHRYIPMGGMVLEERKWFKVEDIIDLPTPESQNDRLVLYPYTVGDKNILIDDIRYEVITIKE